MNQLLSADGFFEVIRAEPAAATRLILVCRGGRVFGADPKGRVYLGKLVAREKQTAGRSFLKGIYEIPLKRRPLRRTLVQRKPIVRLPITGEVDALAHTQNATIRVGDRMIEIRITYLGPLPP